MKTTFITGVVAGLSCLFAYGSADAFGVRYQFAGVNDPGIHGGGVVLLTPTGTPGAWFPTAIMGTVTDDQLSPETYVFTGVVPVGDYGSNTNILFVPPTTSGGITTPGFDDYFGTAFTTDLGVDFSFAAQSATGPYVQVMNNSSKILLESASCRVLTKSWSRVFRLFLNCRLGQCCAWGSLASDSPALCEAARPPLPSQEKRQVLPSHLARL